MGLTKTSDGRYLVGLGIDDADNYNGSQGYRDLVIQLTADGATDSSLEKLNYLREYAIYHSGQGNPVMPPSVSVWISNNGTTTAVEADDISYTDGVYTICGIKYENGAWDFTNAGQGGGGSGLPEVTSDDNGDVLAVVDGAWSKAPAPSSLPPYTSADKGKGLFLAEDAEHSTTTVIVPEQNVSNITIEADVAYGELAGSDIVSALFTLNEGDDITLKVNNNTYTITEIGHGISPITQGPNVFIRGEIDPNNGPWVTLSAEEGAERAFFSYVSSGLIPVKFSVLMTKTKAVVAPAWVQRGVVTVTIVENEDKSVNTADYLFKVNGVVLTSFSDCKTFLESLADAVSIKMVPEGAESGIYVASLGATIAEEENVNIATITIYDGLTFAICGYEHISVS